MKKFNAKESFGLISELKHHNMAIVFIELLSCYIIISIVFALLYYKFNVLENVTGFFDYIYFSFVTSLSIGYGDFVPITLSGKILIIIQACIAAMYFALMISILSIKMFYPRELLKFSDKVIYNSDSNMLILRIINLNREALVNPDLRISITEHNTGNESVGIYEIPTDYKLTYIGKYDYSYVFNNNIGKLNIMEEVKNAVEYNNNTKSLESRFRINVSITGNYTFKQIAIYKKYYAEDVVEGKFFKPIIYEKNLITKKET